MKKILIRLLATATVFSAALICAYASEPIYSYKEEIPVSDSITLTKVEEFYADYNLSYSYIKADLSNDNTSLELLTSDKGTDIIENMATLSETNPNTVAALNGDFYSVHKGVKGFSLGVEIKNGEIVQSPINPDTMATVSYADGVISMGYPEFRISLTAPNGETANVRHLNKHTTYYGDILMYTSDFNGGMSPAPGADVVEVVVSDSRVVEKRYGQSPVEIPEDGCVFVVAESSNPFFLKNISVDDEIEIEYHIMPELAEGQTSFGGGAMLIQDGEIVSEFSHVVSGRHPRSAIGADESGETLYLVAVNGRQANSRGLTMTELAELMLRLGCHNAVNLDGGGSTHMTASTVWNSDIHTVNTPTENRKVINAVGLVYKTEEQRKAEEELKDEAVEDKEIENEDTKTEEMEDTPAKEPDGLLIETDKKAVFLGHPVKITVAAYDENMRPVDCEIDISSAFGIVEDGVFTPEVSGWTTVEAMCGEAYASVEIYVVEAVAGIDAASHIRLSEGESTELVINVFDSLGNYVEITDTSAFEIYSSNPSVASVEGKTLTALTAGTSIVTIQKEGVQTNISVAVGRETKSYKDNFGFVTGKFKPYPADVKGSFEYVSVPEISQSSVGKLSWDFTEEENTAAEASENGTQQAVAAEAEIESKAETENEPETEAENETAPEAQPASENAEKKQEVAMGVYLSFDEKMQLSDTEVAVKVQFYSEKDFKHTLKAQFIDANGNISIASFGDEYAVGEWQTLTAEVPETAVRPLKLDSIYVVYVPGENAVRDAGCVYLDDLSFDISVPVKFEAAQANAYAVEQVAEESETKLAAGLFVKDNNNSIYADFVNSFTEEKMSAYENSFLLGKGTSLGSKEDDNALYITLDTSKGGIRSTNSIQWSKLKELSETTDKNNIFIISDHSVFGASEFENRVLADYLASLGKNVYVITGGNRNTYKIVNGVNYFTVGNDLSETVTLTHLTNYTFLEFDLAKENITFSWKKAVDRI